MVSENFDVGDLVWAKMKGYPPWPAKIEEPPDTKTSKHKKSQYVFFFGTENYAWIQNENISHHSESMLETAVNKKKSVLYQKAIEDLVKYSKINKEKFILLKDKKEKTKTPSGEPKKKVVKVLDSPVKQHERKVMVHKTHSKKFSRKRQNELSIDGSTKKSYSKLPKYESEDIPCLNLPIFSQYYRNEHLFQDKLDPGSNSKTLKRKNVSQHRNKRFGFIGLGYIGRGVVKNLINSKHDVTVWNKTVHKCDPFVRIGAKKALSPADLVIECDIIFCCVSDPEASKSIIFGDKGILKGLQLAERMGMKSKGYVEMTLMDPQTSEEIAEAVIMKNGKYLEAPVCGNSENAQNGTLLVLAAGDRKLFMECETCFHAMGKRAYYISCDVGYGSKMALILSAVSGAIYAALAEAIILIERSSLSKEAFIDILELGPLRCDGIVDKARRMNLRDYRTVTPLRHMQKDLHLSLAMGNKYSQPMHVTAAANDAFIHARLLQYSDSDVSAVLQGVRL